MLKKKNIYVIFITVLIVFLVVVSSFLGLIIYLQWRQLNFALSYYESLEKFDTALYAKNIAMDSLKIKLGFRELPVLEGRISNKGKRAVVSLALKINFLDNVNKPVYSCMIHPLEPFSTPRFFKKLHFTHFAFLKEPLIKPDSVTLFKWTLWRCPRKFVKMLRKNLFSNRPGEWCGEIGAEVTGVRLKPI